jgi:hypothetical protein
VLSFFVGQEAAVHQVKVEPGHGAPDACDPDQFLCRRPDIQALSRSEPILKPRLLARRLIAAWLR